MENYSVRLFESLKRYMQTLNCDYDIISEEGKIEFGLDVECKAKSCDCMFLALETDIGLCSFFPYNAEPQQYAQVAQYITRVNEFIYGCFMIMDYDDGSIALKCYGMCDNEQASQEHIEMMLNTVGSNWDIYGDGLLKVLLGGANPKEVIEEILNEE